MPTLTLCLRESSADKLNANSLDPDQAPHFVGPDLDPNSDTMMVCLKEIFKKEDFEKISR